MKEKVIGNSQGGFSNSKSCLTNPITFCDKMIRFVDEERTVGVIYLNFSKALDTVSHISVSKLRHYGLDR